MESNKILQSDILDLLFEGKNKEYGAYDLRKHYNGRLGRAIAVTAGLVLAVFCFGFAGGRGKVEALPSTFDVNLAPPPATPLPPTPPPPVIPKAQPQVATRIFTAPKLVEHDVPDDEKPPVNDELEKTKIGTVNAAGSDDAGVDAGPASVAAGTGIVEKPVADPADDGIFRKVEIESSYPGGSPAWARFLNKNLNYPMEAQEHEIQGIIMVEFIVDKEGNISDVQAISGPTEGGLREEAIRVIRKSGKWVPAIQNGRTVKSYKHQPVIFRFSE